MEFKAWYYNEIFTFIHETALHLAVKMRYDDIVKLLLNNPKIDINIKNKIFIVFKRCFFIQFLVFIKNFWKTPFDLANCSTKLLFPK